LNVLKSSILAIVLYQLLAGVIAKILDEKYKKYSQKTEIRKRKK
jgi:hypothetical protein